MSVWKWKDVELEVDMEDIEFQEKYEVAFQHMGVSEKELQNVGNLSGFSKKYCMLFWNLFDEIFGKGTADKLFDGLSDDTEIKQRIMYRSLDLSTIKDKDERKRIQKIQRSIQLPQEALSDYDIGDMFA